MRADAGAGGGAGGALGVVMRGRKSAGTEQAVTRDGYASATCPVCGAAMEVYEIISFDDTEVLWIGTCPECGTEVEGETPEEVQGGRP